MLFLNNSFLLTLFVSKLAISFFTWVSSYVWPSTYSMLANPLISGISLTLAFPLTALLTNSSLANPINSVLSAFPLIALFTYSSLASPSILGISIALIFESTSFSVMNSLTSGISFLSAFPLKISLISVSSYSLLSAYSFVA